MGLSSLIFRAVALVAVFSPHLFTHNRTLFPNHSKTQTFFGPV